MILKEIIDLALLQAIDNKFGTYARLIDIEKYPAVHVFSSLPAALLAYKHDFGSLIASDLLEEYKAGTVTANDIAELIQIKYFRNWLAYFDLDHIKYDPLYNVDVKEKRTITTVYGKVVTDEQLTDGHSNTTHGKVETSEQLEDGYNNTTHGKVQTSEQIENSINTNSEYGYNSDSPDAVAKTELDGGKTQLSDSGTTDINISAGKVQSSETGTTNTSISDGKKSETNSGTDIVTDEFEKSGNQGVTKSTEMFLDQMDLLSKWNYLDLIFYDLNKEFTYLIWEVC